MSRRPPAGVVVLDFRPITRAVRQMVVGMQAAARILGQVLARLPKPAPVIPLHGFTPNFDLCCTVCGVGPEECRGGRP